MDRAAILKAIRSPLILAIIGATVVVLIIWLVVVFLPQGSKVSKLNAQAVSLQAQQNALNARVQSLKRLKNAGLQRLQNQYSTLVPSAPDTAQYLKELNAIVSQSGVTLTSVSIATPVAPAVVPSSSAATTGSTAPKTVTSVADTINITLVVTGTYDQQLQLIQLVYAAPRLTTIATMSLSGGGPMSNRSTSLTATYAMTIYELPGSATTSTTTTTTTSGL